jgi:DNA-binding transcriptional MerR regulator/methylmalonyl-CoA mutase cobalamin-binding subunit
MYNIKQAAIRSGVSVSLIRAWERRYGVVSPSRAPSGYRLYDDEAIATLGRVRELIETGWSASEASRAILAGEIDMKRVTPAPTSSAIDSPAWSRRQDLLARFLEAATAMDIAATAAVLDEMLAQGSFESIVDDLLMPALASLGDAWADGRLDVAGEHAASAAIHRRLSALYEAAAFAGDARVVVGLPPEGRHELGALAFAVALRRQGVGVLYLGADVPIASWLHAVQQQHARVVVMAVVQEAEQRRALEVAAALRGAGHVPVVAVGGRSARWDGAQAAGLVVLPSRINEAASVAAKLAARVGAR